jgi:hypothetical protein
MGRRNRDEDLAYGREKELARFRLARRELARTLGHSDALTKDVRETRAQLDALTRRLRERRKH